MGEGVAIDELERESFIDELERKSRIDVLKEEVSYKRAEEGDSIYE